MMKQAGLIVLAMVVALGAGSVMTRAQDGGGQDAMPTRQYVIEIDGQAHELSIDQPIDVTIDGQKHQVALRVKPHVSFDWRGISFEFPQQFTYSLDNADPTFSQWDMSGVNASIMLQCFEDGTSADLVQAVLIPGVKAQFQGLRVEESKASIKFDSGVSYSGTQLKVMMPDVAIIQQVYVFEHNEKAYALWLQDTLTDAGEMSEEYKAMLATFKKTYSVK